MSDQVRVLYAWELGDNYGHLFRGRAIGEKLRLAGHPILFAVRNSSIAAEVLAPCKLRFVQAPIHVRRGIFSGAMLNYADILLASGYDTDRGFTGLLESWMSLILLFGASVVVADHAPTALIAARILNLPMVAIGTGFEIPPDVSPFPRFFPRHANAEPFNDLQVLNRVNRSLAHHHLKAIPALSTIFGSADRMITCYPDLDHYGRREDVRYVGPLVKSTPNLPTEWRTQASVKVIVYLRGSNEFLSRVLRAISELSAEAICIFPDADLSQLSQYDGISLNNDLIDFSELLAFATVVVSNGGTALVNETLSTGVPLILFPQYDEQLMAAKRVANLGAGMVLGHQATLETIRNALSTITENAKFRGRAQAFGRRNRVATYENTLAEIVTGIIKAGISRR